MYELFFFVYVIFYVISLSGCFTYPIFLKIILKRRHSPLAIAINSVSFFLGRVIFPSFYVFSLIIVFPTNINNLLFKFALLFGFFDLGLLLFNIADNKSYNKYDLAIHTIFMFLSGLMIGTLARSDSVNLVIESSETPPYLVLDISRINYTYDLPTQIIIVIFFSFLIFAFIYYGVIIHVHSRNKTLSKMILAFNLALSVTYLSFILYALTGNVIFRELYFIIIQIMLLTLTTHYLRGKGIPSTNMTTKIYSINIYHKSGVQLYAYRFVFDTPKTESSIWGNILIGLNHIIGEFIETEDQINVMRTKNSDIIVEYNKNYGFAVLLSANKKNAELSTYMNDFTNEFELTFKNELEQIQDLNNLIDISEFKGVEDLIKKHFVHYL